MNVFQQIAALPYDIGAELQRAASGPYKTRSFPEFAGVLHATETRILTSAHNLLKLARQGDAQALAEARQCMDAYQRIQTELRR